MTSTTAIYEGFWTNWTDGKVLGATLTLSSRNASFLIAFLALYVAVAGTHCWQLLCLTIFQIRSRPTHPGEISYASQQQAVIRNSVSSFRAMVDLVAVVAKWRRRQSPGKRLLWTSAGLIFIAILNMTVFFVAGIFSSRVTSTRSDVLLVPTQCGYWPELPPGASLSTLQSNQTADWQAQMLGLNVAESWHFNNYCYGPEFSNPSDKCNALGRDFVNWTSTMSDECPFEGIPCAGQSVVLDSGIVDSHIHLGINSQPEDRVAYRHHIQCSTLQLEDYTKTYDWSNITELIVDPYFFLEEDPNCSRPPDPSHPRDSGPCLNQAPGNQTIVKAIFLGSSATNATNATYIWNSLASYSWNLNTISNLDKPYYIAAAQQEPEGSPNNDHPFRTTFHALPGLTRANSSTFLVFLTNDMLYNAPVTDPWFNSTTPEALPGAYDGAEALTMYHSDNPVAGLACFETNEVCNIGVPNGKCAPLDSYGSPLQDNLTSLLNLNPQQATVMARLTDNLSRTGLLGVINNLGGPNLLAKTYVYSNTSPGLPDNQWVLELQNWFSIHMTQVQLSVSQFVTGFRQVEYNQYIEAPDPSSEWMCHNQITKSNDYSSFSVLGLIIILAIGGLLIISNICVGKIADWVRLKRRNHPLGHFRTQDWKDNALLQLHERAYESQRTTSNSAVALLGKEDRQDSVLTKSSEKENVVVATFGESESPTVMGDRRKSGEEISPV